MSRTTVRLARATAAAAALAAILSGCATTIDGPGRFRDQTVGPSQPQRPPLDAADYDYTLMLSCQCPWGGTPVRVTVEDGEAVRAVVLEDGYNHEAGEAADDDDVLVTINEVIDAVNDREAFHVDVDWPSNQDWPNRVNVDPQENVADEEYGYRIADVVIAR